MKFEANIKFNVISWDVNHRVFKAYDVIPTLIRELNDAFAKSKTVTYEEVAQKVKDEALYHYWSKCEWEIILSDWPGQQTDYKMDVYEQIMYNFDLIVNLIWEKCRKQK